MNFSLLNQNPKKTAEKPGPQCECGRSVSKPGRPCDRCVALDGETAIQNEVIRALQQEPRTCREIAELYDAHVASVYRVLCRLVRDKRAAVIGRRPLPDGLAPLYGWRGLADKRKCK